MDYSTSENESLSEVETLKQQLNTYKLINADLSKKIQLLKVELSAFRQENTKIKNELLDEKTKSAEYRRHFATIHTKCVNFFNSYVNDIQQISDNNSTLIEGIPMLTTPENNDDDSPGSSTIVPNVKREQRLPIREQLRNSYTALTEDNFSGNNMLNTIAEESLQPVTSTPIIGCRNEIFRPSNTSPENEESDLSPTRTNCSDSLVVETPKNQLNPTVRRISQISDIQICLNDQNEENNCTETNGDDITKQDKLSHDIKECRIALSPLKSNYSTNVSTQSRNDTNDDEESTLNAKIKKENKSKSTKPRNSLKRKSNERLPRRRARPTSLVEPSLQTKLRRTSDKKK